MEGAGPYSMLAVSALENHVQTLQVGSKKYAAVRLEGGEGGDWYKGCNVTTAMIFCLGILGYDNQQRLILRDMMGGGDEVKPGDWIVMLSRTCFRIMRESDGESLFALMPDVPRSTPDERLSRIAQAHKKDVDSAGGTHGLCVECYQPWNEEAGGCPTKVWATTDRDVLATWDPADDETETPEGVEDADS